MMLRSKSNPWMRTKALYIIPMATIAVSVFATPELNNRVDTLAEKVETIIENKGTNNSSIDQVSEKGIASVDNIKENIAKNAKDSLTTKAEEYTKPAWDTCTWNENDPATWKFTDPQADVRPQFPGEKGAFSKYLRQHEHLFKEYGPSIWVTFVIEEDGSATVKECGFPLDIKVDEKKAQNIIKEFKKMFANMPKWIPAQKDGKNVPYSYNLSIGGINIDYEKIKLPEPPEISWDD